MSKLDPNLNEPVVKALLNANFVKAVMKPGSKTNASSTIEGQELKKWMKPLQEAHYPTKEFASEIHVSFPTDVGLPAQPLTGVKGTLSPAQSSFLYLDVGAWIGSAKGAWGHVDAAAKTGEYVKRDFGIVCGELVALCSFRYATNEQHCPEWEEMSLRAEEPFRSVSKLIGSISRAASKEQHAEGEGLGECIVREVMIASSANPRWPERTKDYVIHVILGDMHMPVLSQEIDTYGGKARVTSSGAIDPPARVPRLGRLDIRPMEALVKALVGASDDDGADFLGRVVKFFEPFLDMSTAEAKKLAAMRGGKIGGALGLLVATGQVGALAVAAAGISEAALLEAWRISDWEGVRDGDMRSEDAKAWFEYYRKGVDGGKPGDIFEEAGDHYLHFAMRLAEFVKKEGHLPVKFLQLGDMIDFWVGFSGHFQPSNNNNVPVANITPHGLEMVHAWTANLFANTDQGRKVAEALDLATAFEPVYLYGNHDNYLGSGLSPEYSFRGERRHLQPRERRYDRLGTFMEHGHQWETSNADNAPLVPVAANLTMGTPAPLGMLVTQAAFIRPGPVRGFEGMAAGASAKASGTYGQRLDQIIGAGYRFLASSGGFYVYVMGHTHESCLSRVVLTTQNRGSLETFQRDSVGSKKVGVVLTQNNVVFEGEKVAADRRVTVEWRDMLGDSDSEWLELADPFSPSKGSFEKAVRGLAVKNPGKKTGAHVFPEVPAGAYVARYYLTHDAEEPFRTSHNTILVPGISVEGDARSTVGQRFELDPSAEKQLPNIFIRWAFDERDFDDQDAWFAVFRTEEGFKQQSILSRSSPHPVYKFLNAAKQGTGVDGKARPSIHGRWNLVQVHSWHWDLHDPHRSPIGKWTVAAFGSHAWRPLGEAHFEVVPKAAKKGHP